MMFLGLRKLGKICCGHKMFLNKIRNIFVSRTQNLCPQQMLRARANGETFVSATMCLQQRVLVCQGLNKDLSSSSLHVHASLSSLHVRASLSSLHVHASLPSLHVHISLSSLILHACTNVAYDFAPCPSGVSRNLAKCH